jgi:hypothetical protein
MPAKNHKKIMALIIATCLMITAFPGLAWGEYTLVGGNSGLVIEIPKKTVDTGNLNPGDQKGSHFRITNPGSNTVNLFIRTNIIREDKPNGGYLADVMTLSIKEGDNIIANDIVRKVVEAGNILVGSLSPGQTMIIDLDTHLPPASTGNEYQKAFLSLNWTFTVQTVSGGGSSGGGSGGGDENEVEDPEITIFDEPIPGGPMPTEEIEIEPEEVPFGVPIMPQTGEALPTLPYLMGFVAIGAGLKLISKKEN